MKKKFLHLAAMMIMALMLSVGTKAQISLSVNIAPPALITYSQPVCPGDGYMWIPGYWAYSPETGYYWVPGYWTLPPDPGLLWTPGYWGFVNGAYIWNPGYWGTHIGFYGGINYGFGYFGTGYVGGRWRGNTFVYNTAVTNVNKTVIHNTYVDNHYTVVNNNRYSFNGKGGISAKPTATERQYATQQHYQPTSEQRMQHQAAIANTDMHYQNNNGRVKQENIDRQHQNFQNFRSQHQAEPEFKSAPHAVPMMRGGRGGKR
ncbi:MULTISPECIES: YXWGXW repeat-containing protein [Chitinophagaceae]